MKPLFVGAGALDNFSFPRCSKDMLRSECLNQSPSLAEQVVPWVFVLLLVALVYLVFRFARSLGR